MCDFNAHDLAPTTRGHVIFIFFVQRAGRRKRLAVESDGLRTKNHASQILEPLTTIWRAHQPTHVRRLVEVTNTWSIYQ